MAVEQLSLPLTASYFENVAQADLLWTQQRRGKEIDPLNPRIGARVVKRAGDVQAGLPRCEPRDQGVLLRTYLVLVGGRGNVWYGVYQSDDPQDSLLDWQKPVPSHCVIEFMRYE